MTDTVQMRALRRFPRMDGQAIRPMQEGEEFSANFDEVARLSASGKAELVNPEQPAKRGKKGAVT